MSDLSRLIGNVYRSPDADAETPAHAPVDETWAPEQVEQLADQEEPTPEPSLEDEWAQLAAEGLAEAKAPEWADDAALDEAFAGWVPGEPGTAPEAERDAHSELPAELGGTLPGLAALADMDVSGTSQAPDTTSLWSLDTDAPADTGAPTDAAVETVADDGHDVADPWSSIGSVHAKRLGTDTDTDTTDAGPDLFGTWAAWGDDAVADAATTTVEEWTPTDAGSWALEDEVDEWATGAVAADGPALDYTEAEEWTAEDDASGGADEWAIDYAETDQWGGDEAATAWTLEGGDDVAWTVETDAATTWAPVEEATVEWGADPDPEADTDTGPEGTAAEWSPAADWASDEPAGWDASGGHRDDTSWGTLRPTALAAAVDTWATDEPGADEPDDAAAPTWERGLDDLLPRASGLRRFRRRR